MIIHDIVTLFAQIVIGTLGITGGVCLLIIGFYKFSDWMDKQKDSWIYFIVISVYLLVSLIIAVLFTLKKHGIIGGI